MSKNWLEQELSSLEDRLNTLGRRLSETIDQQEMLTLLEEIAESFAKLHRNIKLQLEFAKDLWEVYMRNADGEYFPAVEVDAKDIDDAAVQARFLIDNHPDAVAARIFCNGKSVSVIDFPH
jgi:hypothetical protein